MVENNQAFIRGDKTEQNWGRYYRVRDILTQYIIVIDIGLHAETGREGDRMP